MNEPRHEQYPVELQGTVERLRHERPALTPLELDRVKLQAKSQAARSRPTFLSIQKGRLMKSRMALTTMIAAGLLMSGGGAGLAVSGISSDGSAGVAQYRTETAGGGSGVLGTEDTSGSKGGDGVAGASAEHGGGAAGASGEHGGVQAARQVSAQDEGGLPFTGLAAIPLLVVGAGLLGAGTVMRRRLPDSA